ncbi:MAG: hypothetical protein RBU30_14790, partial [Polyangia bacterium]|nr:hypothetical protein [Polyangia bacterium]
MSREIAAAPWRGALLGALSCLLIAGCGDKHKNDNDAGPHPDGWVDPDATTDGGGTTDATAPLLPHITSVEPSGIPCTQDTQVSVFGVLLPADATVVLVNCDTGEVLEVESVTATGNTQYSFTLPAQPDCAELQGLYRVELSGPEGTLASPCGIYLSAFEPPIVTDVSPPYAYAGDPLDGILSDRLVTITGEGFRSTPSVKLISADTPSLQYESTMVSFVNAGTITAVVPSESRQMPPGDYWVYVMNPDLLQGQWLVDTDNDGVGDEPGLFTIMSVPPPIIDYISPARPTSNACPLTLEIIGTGFVTGSEAFILVPSGTNCPTGTTQTVVGECRLSAACADAENPAQCSGTRIAADLSSCPAKGFYPIRVRNPDGQLGDFFFLTITESATAHLNESFVNVPQPLSVGRQRAGGVTGFDAVGESYIYVAGGLDGSRNVLGGGERAPVSVFGELGPWSPLVQYHGPAPADLRRPNLFVTPRHG